MTEENRTAEIVAEEMRILQEENDQFRYALQDIRGWASSYPLKIFPEPNLREVKEILEAAGIDQSALHATWARALLDGVGRRSSVALNREWDDE